MKWGFVQALHLLWLLIPLGLLCSALLKRRERILTTFFAPEVLDHLVIGHRRWISLRERGLGFEGVA